MKLRWGRRKQTAVRPFRAIRPGLVLLLFLSAAFAVKTALADSMPGEPEIKAAFLLNFIKFVEWPSSAFKHPGDSMLVCVAGTDPIEPAVSRLDGKRISGRKLVVRKVSDISSLERCHILFVGESEKGRVGRILGAVQRRPILTVANFEGFAGRGGMIDFVRQGDRIGFEINEEAARKAGLKVSAKLLYLGKPVRDNQGGGR